MKKNLLLLFSFIAVFFWSNIFAQGDDPCAATTLTVNSSCTFSTYTNASATATSGPPAPGCASYSGGDVWFKATVPASGNLNFDSQTGGITDGGMAVYSASSCSASMTLIECDDDDSPNGLMPYISLTGLSSGSTVWIRFWEYGNDNNGTFQICVSSPVVPPGPANDNPCGAVSLPINSTCTYSTYSNAGATATSGPPAPGCSSYSGGDVWFSVTVPASGNLQFNSNTGVMTDGGMAIYSASSCSGSMTLIECDDDDSPNGMMPYINRTGLTPGTTVWIRFWEYGNDNNGTFQICAVEPAPPAGCGSSPVASDFCSSATAICDLNGYCGNTSSSYTSTGAIPTAFCGSVENNSWLKFVASATTSTFTATASNCTNGWGIQIEVYSVSNCGNASGFTSVSNCWNPAVETTGTITATGLTIGNTYYIMIDGNAGDVCDYMITANTGVSIPVNAGNNVSICQGLSTTLSASGGNGTYTWSPSSGLSCTNCVSPVATPSTTTSYIATSSTGNPLCPSSTADTVVVTVNPLPTTSVSPASSSICNGASTSLTASGANTYSWSPSAGLSATTGATVTASPTTTTTYTVTGTSAGCTKTATVTVTVTPAPSISVSPASSSICTGNSTSLTASGATTYAWSPSTGLSSTTGATVTASPTATTTYTVTGSSAGCPNSTATVTVTISSTGTSTFTYNGNQCLTNNSFNFSNTGSMGGGVTNSWTFTGGNPSTSGLASPSGITWSTPGTYAVSQTVTSGSCPSTTTQNIIVYPLPTVTPAGTNPLCNGGCTGSVSASGSGGNPGYTYLWSGALGSGTPKTNICAGTYTVTLSDANACTATNSVTLTNPPVISGTASATNILCNGVCNGTLSASGSGGASPYSYSWSGSLGTGGTKSSVCAGTYTVTITDNSGCVTTASATVNQPVLLAASASATNATCSGTCNGTLSASASGGTTGYTYVWSGGLGSGSTKTAVCSGTYTVTVTDANGCTKTASATVNQPTALTLSPTGTNVTCNATCNGTASASALGGTSAYSYAWSAGLGTGTTKTGLCAGTYTVTVTDAAGCVATGSTTISQPTALSVTPTPVPATCNGTCNGTLSAAGSGGTTGYTYTWSGGLGTGASKTAVCAGSYTVTITDANGCTSTATASVTQPALLAASATGTNPGCSGTCNGTLSGSGAGGATPYTYSWSGGLGTGATKSAVCAGTYTVTVTDANGCNKTASYTLSVPAGLTATASTTAATCNGTCNGTVTASGSGGTTGYTYTWSGGLGTGASKSSVCAGTYTVTVTDANLCTTTASVTVIQPTAVAGSVTPAAANCNGTCNGTLAASGSGGTSPFTYSWSGGLGSGASITGVCAGTFTVTITDGNGCTGTASGTVNQPAALSVISTPAGSTCNGTCNGTLSAAGSGGTTGYTYTWSGGLGTGAGKTAVCAGSYTVTITDANGCTSTATASVTEPTLLAASATGTNPGCSGTCNGTLSGSGSGGATPYTYSWSGGLGTGATKSAVCAGTYTVTVTDANGCTKTASYTLSGPAGLTATASTTAATCNGTCNGTVTASGSGGTTGYTYTWSGGLGTGASKSSVCAGTYTVTVTDANLCTTTASVTVTQPVSLSAAATGTNVNCSGGINGTASVSATGGTGSYTYLWNNSATSAGISGLAAGTFSVTVTDANSCSAISSYTIIQPAALSATANGTNASCNAVCNGSTTATPSGGTSPYSFAWGAGSGFQTSQTATGLCNGSYTVTITDNQSCSATASFSVTQPSAITLTPSSNPASCGNSNGSTSVTANGGTSPYAYLWCNSQTTSSATSLPAGGCTVTVTDANGCSSTTVATVNSVGGPAVSIPVSVDVSCNSGSNGTATASVSGGATPYSYSWAPSGGIVASATGLSAGTYTVNVTDINGCIASASIIVSQPSALASSITSSTSVSCNGLCNGSATVSATGGSTGYSFQWPAAAGSQSAVTATGLCAGSYIVTVTDSKSCSSTAMATITAPSALTSTATAINTLCNSSCNGSADLTPGGGITPYSYSWSNAATSEDITGLCASSYAVTVTDAQGCSFIASTTVNQPSPVSLSTSTVSSTCGNFNGSASISASGGTAGYSYLWSNAQTSSTATGLGAGSYSVTVTDANGCVSSTSTTVTNSGGPSVSIPTSTNVSCFGGNNGSAQASVSGGATPYSYLWSPSGGTGSTASGLLSGSYSVTVTDANGCTAIDNIIIIQPAALSSLISASANVTCNGICDGNATITASGGTTSYSYLWPVSAGSQTTPSATGLCAGNFIVTVTDGQGCTSQATATINQPAALSASAFATSAVCNGSCNGSIDLIPSGGTTSFSYSWDNASTSEDLTALCAGSYSVTVTDANGCFTTTTATVSQPGSISLSTSFTNATCGNSNGTASVTASGGTSGYTYLWENAQTSATATGVAAGNYNVTVTDSQGCIQNTLATVNNAGAPVVITNSLNDVSCFGGNNGSAQASVSGGATPYTYLWSPSGGTGSIASGLQSGNYSVTVTDANGCTGINNTAITQPGVLGAIISSSTNVTCYGLCNGSASVESSGGISPYSYFWEGGGSGTNKAGLCADTFNVTVLDSNGCGTIATVIITEPPAITSSITATPVLCNGFCSGQADLNVSGGTAPFTYVWNNSSVSEDLSSICSGNWDVTITDVNGCTGNSTAIISEPSSISLSSSTLNATCGQSNGQACITATGGTSGFSYLWSTSPSQTSSCASAIGAGSYPVTVTDANGCVATTSIIVNNFSGGTATATVTSQASGAGICNGSANAAMTGGTSPYTYTWNTSPAQTTISASGLCAGSYCVTITDANGCSSTDCVVIAEPSAVTAISVGTDVQCYGDCDASVNVTVSGGVSPYSFLWSNGATAKDISNLCAGTYILTVTDSNSNITTSMVVITSPGIITASATPSNIVCNGTCNGSIVAGISGGTEPYTFLWSSGQSTSSVTGLCAGTYSLTVTDFSGCTASVSSIISQPPSMTLSSTSVNANCGANDGNATVVASGGQTPYSYSWSAGGNTLTQTGLAAGTYTVSVIDNNNCQANISVVVNNNSAGIPSAVVDNNVLCYGENNGQATASITGGTSPYTYKWGTTPMQTSAIATGLSAGTYSITITDANCATVTSVTILEPQVITSTATATGAGCFGSCNGNANVTATGGSSPYSYQWDDLNFQITLSATGLCANNYSVTVSDANGCTVTNSTIVSQNAEIVLNTSGTQSTCNQSDANAAVSISSGISPFSYQWDSNAGNQTGSTATGLSANCYSVTVTDGNTCAKLANICITDAGAPSVTLLTKTDISCYNSCDGFAQISVSGGNPPYSYNWNTIPSQSSASAFNLCEGTYTGSMIDSTGCTASISVVIAQPPVLSAIFSSQTNASCFSGCDGSANALISGGSTPYSFSWNDPSAQNTSSATGLCPGTYSLVIGDANSCDTSLSVVITEPLLLEAVATSTSAVCSSASGSACVTGSGGQTPYTYVWNNGQTGNCASNLVPGNYSVTVSDSNNCTAEASIIVGNIPSGNASVSGVLNVSCNGICDGQATVSMGGSGNSPYAYQWDSIAANQTTPTATGLCEGNFGVTVTDANGCTSTSTAVISSPLPMAIGSQASDDITCFGTCNGSAVVNATGGNTPYNYLWNDPLAQVGKEATGLCSGVYMVTIADANNCSITQSVSITEPGALILNPTSLSANCNQSNGSGCVIASGGTTPYSYLWQNGNINPCAAALAAGTYVVTVTDGNGCLQNASVQIQNINGPSALISSQTNVDCQGNCNGSVTAAVSSGVAPYTFQWGPNAGNQITPTASNLCAGIYTVTITDSAGCSISISATINEPVPISYNQQKSDPDCYGDCNGSAWVTVTGGTSPYSFQWSDSQSNDTAISICAGSYILTVTDANSCTEILNYSLINPAQITTSMSTVSASCFGVCDGKATVNVSNGNAPYLYLWNDLNSQSSQQADGLCGGIFSVTITDDNGCQGISTGTVIEPPALLATINNSGNVSCSGQCNGYAQVSVSGGTPAYMYQWSNSSISQVNSNLCSGSYTVTVTDANNCSQSVSINIIQPVSFSSSITGSNVACGGNCDGQAALSPSGGNAPYNYLWSANTGFQNSSTATALCGGNYSVTITDSIGCKIYKNVTILEPTPLGVALNSKSDANCGQDNGSICMNVTGGSAPYTYQWNDPNTQTSSCASSLYAGCYSLFITDAAGCVADSLLCINDIAGPTIAVDSFRNVTCAGAANGYISFNVTGGITPYDSVQWLNGTTPVLNGPTISSTLNGGTYTLIITDDAGCLASLSQSIFEPQPIVSAVTSSGNVSCNSSCNGWATVGAYGGLSPYSYSWAGTIGSATATGLCAGVASVIITDINLCTKTQMVQITEPDAISVTSAITDATCNSNCNGTVNLNVSGGTAPYLYTWSPGSAVSPSAYNLCIGTYFTTITDGLGCTFTQTSTVNEPLILNATLTEVNAICSQCNGQATVAGTGGSTPYTYNWGTGQLGGNLFNLCPGVNLVTVTDLNGCAFDTSINISDAPAPQISGFAITTPSCNGMNNGIATVNYTGGTGNLGFLWSGGQTSPTIGGLTAGTYSVIILDANSCSDTQSVSVNQPSAVAAVVNGSDTLCYGESTQIWASGSGGVVPYTVKWLGSDSGLTGIGPHNINPMSDKSYLFTIYDANNCSANGVISIIVGDPLQVAITTGDTVSLCNGQSATICAQAQGGEEGSLIYLWSNGISDSCQTVAPQATTSYNIIVSDGCSLNDTAEVYLPINAVPQIDFSSINESGCPPLEVSFFSSANLQGLSYQWDFDEDGVIDSDSSTATFTFTQSGDYDVMLSVVSVEGCTASVTDTHHVSVYPNPTAGFTVSDTVKSILKPDIDFDATGLTNGADSIVWWNWGDNSSDSGLSFLHFYNDTGTYLVTLTAINKYGCKEDTTQIIKIIDDFIIFVPNAFTPNKDGKNDGFMPKGVGINPERFKMWIFDRWGDIIFETNNINTAWDGTAHGGKKPVQIGVYIWLIEAVDDNGGMVKKMGHVTVYR